jgi:hypothetical protein
MTNSKKMMNKMRYTIGYVAQKINSFSVLLLAFGLLLQSE